MSLTLGQGSYAANLSSGLGCTRPKYNFLNLIRFAGLITNFIIESAKYISILAYNLITCVDPHTVYFASYN